MGNRSYLYLLDKAPAQQGEVQDQIAEANNNLPLFWRILLAGSSTAEAIRDQRVFGDADSPNLAADLAPGIARLRRFLAFAKTLAGVKKIRHWLLYAESMLEWLQAMQADHPEARISANIDELLWLDDSGNISQAIQQTREEIDRFWQQLDAAIEAKDKQAAQDLLLQELQGSGQTLADWNFWQWQFGIGGINHPYFEENYDETVRDVSFSQFDTRGGVYLSFGAETFVENNLVGIRDRQTHTILLPAKYDLIRQAQEYSQDENVWTRRDELWGIVRLREVDDEHCTATEVRAPDLAEIWPFPEGEDLTLARQGSLHGWLNRDGQWVIQPQYTEASTFAFGLAGAAMEDGLAGYIDRSGEWVIPPQFWSMWPFESCGLTAASMAEDQPWGLINRQGKWVVEPTFDDIEWRSWQQAWGTNRADKHGLLHPDGRVLLEPVFDEISPLNSGILQVRQAKQWGICAQDGQAAIACEYRKIEAVFDGWHDQKGPALPDWFIVSRGKTCGVIALDGQWIVPAQFADIVNPAQMLHVYMYLQRGDVPPWQDCFIVESTGKKSERKQGVWSVSQQKLVLPLQFDAIWPVIHPLSKESLFFTYQQHYVHDDGSTESRNAAWRSDGSAFFPGDYCWFDSTECWLKDAQGWHSLHYLLKEIWPAGKPILAMRASDYSLCHLFPDGHEEDQNAYLLAKAESGSVSAAWEVGQDFYDRTDDPECAAQACKYLLIAAEKGQHVLGKNYQEAIWRLAYLQMMGIGTDADPVSARAWLERAYKPNGHNPALLMVNLGYLYTEGLGGETRKAEALALFERAASESQDDVGAYNAADMLENGEAGEIDLPRALDYFRLSAREGYAKSWPRIGNILQKLAHAASGEQQGDLYRQALAAYREAEQQELPEKAKNSLALNLGRLLLRHLPDESRQDEAVVLLQTAAESGEQEAIDILATEVFGPNGCRPDAQQASRWQAVSGVPSHQKGFIMPLLAVIFGVAFVWLLLQRG